jgi:hypothetical protein
MVSVGCLNEARNGPAIPCLTSSHESSETILVAVVYIDVVSRTDEAKGVEDTAEMLGKFEILEQPQGFTSCCVCVGYHGAGITARTLERAETEGL